MSYLSHILTTPVAAEPPLTLLAPLRPQLAAVLRLALPPADPPARLVDTADCPPLPAPGPALVSSPATRAPVPHHPEDASRTAGQRAAANLQRHLGGGAAPREVRGLGVHPAVGVHSVAAHGPRLEAVAAGVGTLGGNIVIVCYPYCLFWRNTTPPTSYIIM